MKKLLLAILLMAVPSAAVVAQFVPGQVLTANDLNNISAIASSAQTTANAALPKTGGTLTGALVGTSATFTGALAGSGITLDGAGVNKLTQRGSSTSANTALDIITLSAASTDNLGSAGVKGWRLQGRSNAFATTAQQNDFYLDYWNGTSWSTSMIMDAASTAVSFTGNVAANDFSAPSGTLTTLTSFAVNSPTGWSAYTASTERLRFDTGGNVTNLGGVAEAGKTTTTQTTGFSYTVPTNRSVILLSHASTLASGTITMPASPVDGQLVRIATKSAITALTVSPNTSQSIIGAPTTIAAGGFFGFIYDQGTTAWYRIN